MSKPNYMLINSKKTIPNSILEALMEHPEYEKHAKELILSVYRYKKQNYSPKPSYNIYTIEYFDGERIKEMVRFKTGGQVEDEKHLHSIDNEGVAFIEGVLASFEDANHPIIYTKQKYSQKEVIMVLRKWGCASIKSQYHYLNDDWNKISDHLFESDKNFAILGSELDGECPYSVHPKSERLWVIQDGQLRRQSLEEWNLSISEILKATNRNEFKRATGGLSWEKFQYRVKEITNSFPSWNVWNSGGEDFTTFKNWSHSEIKDPWIWEGPWTNESSNEWQDMSDAEKEIAIAYGIWTRPEKKEVYYFAPMQVQLTKKIRGFRDPIPYPLIGYSVEGTRRELIEAMIKHDHLGVDPNPAIVESQKAAVAAKAKREAEAERLRKERQAKREAFRQFLAPYKKALQDALNDAQGEILATQTDAHGKVYSWSVKIVNVSDDRTKCMISVKYKDKNGRSLSLHSNTAFEDFDNAVIKVIEHLKKQPLTKLFISI